MGLVLSHAKATCSECGHVVHQIDASREHAVEVVREAMEHHIAEAHGDDDSDGIGAQ